MCLCAQRRQNLSAIARGLRAGDTQAIKANIRDFNQSIRTDLSAARGKLAALTKRR